MKGKLLVLVMAFFASAALAQSVHKATGVVTKVDKALPESLGKDKKVDFEFKQEGRDYVVTAVK